MPRSERGEETPEPGITGAAFWALMTRWQVPDDLALAMIAGPPRTATGKRPRFRLVGEQVERYQMLRAIDQHLVNLRLDPAPWLGRSVAAKPFSRRKPMEFMADGRDAIAETLRFLEREAFKNSLAQSTG